MLAAEWAPFGSLSEPQLAKLERHYEMLMRWNKVLNLTRIDSLDEIVRLHYCESMFLGSLLPKGPLNIVDIGSGAGFPGIPMAVLRPECTVTLVEAHKRKAVFLAEACAAIDGPRVIEARAESIQEDFDWLISRAVACSAVLSLGLAPRVAVLTSALELKGLAPPEGVVAVPWGNQRVVALFHVEQQSVNI